MDILKIILVILHFVGLASLLGSFLVQVKDVAAGAGKILPGMFHGALTMVVTGILLYGVHMGMHHELNHMKLGIKFLVLAIITVLVLVFRKKERVPAGVLWGIGGLTLLNVVLAVAWH